MGLAVVRSAQLQQLPPKRLRALRPVGRQKQTPGPLQGLPSRRVARGQLAARCREGLPVERLSGSEVPVLLPHVAEVDERGWYSRVLALAGVAPDT